MFIRELKLDIIANLVTETSVGIVLKELQFYVSDPDKRFVSSAIQSIGRCAAILPDVAERCMRGLMHLVTSHEEV